jgi:hypothetical protein
VPAATVSGFLPSLYGFRFANGWPSNPARILRLGPIAIPIGNTGRGLCGGMVFAARARFERNELAPPDDRPPDPGAPLFIEIVDRQFDSFGRLFHVPLRFWLAAIASQSARDRGTVRDAWPAVKADIDGDTPSMVGIVRQAGWYPLAVGLGHQVVAYRYDESATAITIGIYDPNHPGSDDVTLTVERLPDGSYAMRQSSGEPVIGLLALPFKPAG